MRGVSALACAEARPPRLPPPSHARFLPLLPNHRTSKCCRSNKPIAVSWLHPPMSPPHQYLARGSKQVSSGLPRAVETSIRGNRNAKATLDGTAPVG